MTRERKYTEQMLQMALVSKLVPNIYGKDGLVANLDKTAMLPAIIVYLFAAGVCSMLLIGTFIWAAHHEGRLDALKSIGPNFDD